MSDCKGVRSEACSSCPYRRDVASGVWSEAEYDKLREYDAPTGEQPLAWFACHATPDHICHGWAVVHSNRGHEFELLALRVRGADMSRVPTEASTPLFDSGTDAADHGQADLDDPSPEARATVERLTRKYPRLSDNGWPAGDGAAYADLADELNDYDVTMTLDDFDPAFVAAAHRHAAAEGLTWPPGVGDFDRLVESTRRHPSSNPQENRDA